MTSADEFAEHVRTLFASAAFDDVEVLHSSYDSKSFGNAVALVRAHGLLFRLIRERGDEFVDVAGPAFYSSLDVEEGFGGAAPTDVPATLEPVGGVLRRLHEHRAELLQALQPERTPATIGQLERAREERKLRMLAKLDGRHLP